MLALMASLAQSAAAPDAASAAAAAATAAAAAPAAAAAVAAHATTASAGAAAATSSEAVLTSATNASAADKAAVTAAATQAAGATAAAVSGDALPADFKSALTQAADAVRAVREGADQAAGAEAKPAAEAKIDAQLADIKLRDIKTEAAARQHDTAPTVQAPSTAISQANAATTQAANAVASNQLQARVGSQAWDQQLGQKVVWMVAGGDQSATLTLNPPDLGPLQVVLNVSNDQASASFTAAQPEVRQALENALPKLKEMMSEAGIQLGQASVSAGDPGQQQAFAEAGASRGGRGNGSGLDGGSKDAGTGNAAPQATPRRSILGAVDTFA
jgi:flagellar hook-length control protein FliK